MTQIVQEASQSAGQEVVRSAGQEAMWAPPEGVTPAAAGKTVCAFLDVATTSYGRATHYNTRQEQQAAELAAHGELQHLSRSLYAVMMALPGVTDRAVQVGLKNLLSTPWTEDSFLSAQQEREVLYALLQALPAPRMFKLMDALRVGDAELGIRKANNARTRKLVLRTLLGSSRLQLWSVKYRTKMQRSLVHAWGRRLASIVRQILIRDARLWTKKERGIIGTNVDRHCKGQVLGDVHECIRFVLGDRARLHLPLLVAFEAAKADLSAGKKLPLEVLQGIRATYHPDVSKETVLELVKAGLTRAQRKNVQRQAAAAGIEVAMDPMDYNAVGLYLYAFECGLTTEICAALGAKADRAAAALPSRWPCVTVIVDASQSMTGSATQRLRPMAVTLALRDMLLKTGDLGVAYYCGGTFADDGLVRPMGDTAIAEGLLAALAHKPPPSVVFVISDGYENAPAGRFAEMLTHVRELGIDTPVYHLNPVMAAEAGGVKELVVGDGVPTLPVRSPEALGTTFIRGMIEAEPVRGINMLIRKALEAGPCGQSKPTLLTEG